MCFVKSECVSSNYNVFHQIRMYFIKSECIPSNRNMFHQIRLCFIKSKCISSNKNVFHQIIMSILYSVVFVISHKNDIIQTGWWCFYYNWKLYSVGTQAEIKCMFNLLINFIICSSLNIQSCLAYIFHNYFKIKLFSITAGKKIKTRAQIKNQSFI